MKKDINKRNIKQYCNWGWKYCKKHNQCFTIICQKCEDNFYIYSILIFIIGLLIIFKLIL